MPDLTGRPLYHQIADDVRQQIQSSELEPGARLPSIASLVSTYETSTTTVRQAINLLRNEGLVIGQQGRGTYVRPARERRMRFADHLYRERADGSPLGATIESSGAQPRWDHRSSRSRATPAIAKRLGIDVGDAVMTTEYRFFADEEPIMIATSHEPLNVTSGTPIELPEQSPSVGVVARFDSIGVEITDVIENVTARSPRPYEHDALQVPVGVPVMSIERTYYRDELPVETADVVVAADNYTLSYRVSIPSRSEQQRLL